MSVRTKREPQKAMSHQEKIMELFISSRKESPRDVGQLIDKATEGDTIPLEVAILEFFKMFSVGVYGRNNIRKSISEDTDGEVDIGDPTVFKQLEDLFKCKNDKVPESGEVRLIKQERGDAGSSMGYTIFNAQAEKSKETAMKHFREYLALKPQPLHVDHLIDKARDGDIVPLEKAVIGFFKESKHPQGWEWLPVDF